MTDNRTSFKLKEWGARIAFLEENGVNIDHLFSFSILELRNNFVAEEWWKEKQKRVFAELEQKELDAEVKKDSKTNRLLSCWFNKGD